VFGKQLLYLFSVPISFAIRLVVGAGHARD